MEPRGWVMTTRQAAAALQVSPDTMEEAIRRGQIPAVLVGGRFRISTARLYEYVNGKGTEAGEALWRK